MSTPKTALIIGASRGLGLGLVKQLLKDGWDVTATVRDPSKADALKVPHGVLHVGKQVTQRGRIEVDNLPRALPQARVAHSKNRTDRHSQPDFR